MSRFLLYKTDIDFESMSAVCIYFPAPLTTKQAGFKMEWFIFLVIDREERSKSGLKNYLVVVVVVVQYFLN